MRTLPSPMELELAEPHPLFGLTGIDELMDAAALAEDSGVFKAPGSSGAKHIMRFRLRGTKEEQGTWDLFERNFHVR